MKPRIPLTATLPSDRELRVSREFDAPSTLMFKAYTDPALVVRWLWGPDDWPMAECTIDCRVGGAYRYVWRNAQLGDMAMGGTFLEIDPPTRLVVTELFDQDWTEGETVCTTTFEDLDGGTRTRVTTTVLYSSQTARDNAMKTPMLDGWAMCFDRLTDRLPEFAV